MDNPNAAWGSRSLDLLRELDPEWIESYSRMTINPWLSGALSAKEFALIAVALSAAITNLHGDALHRHIASALRAGATQLEILGVLKMAALSTLHPMSLGAPILIEEAKAAGIRFVATAETETPDWGSIYQLDSTWTEAFLEAGLGLYTNGVLTPKFVELIGIAFDAAVAQTAPGVHRHMKAALDLGATPEEIMTVLKLCVSQGADALYFSVPILAEEVADFERTSTPGQEV
jgi:alkylhydroperoxidase/carboxymuconolactone decarboxylase family protein YurZ